MKKPNNSQPWGIHNSLAPFSGQKPEQLAEVETGAVKPSVRTAPRNVAWELSNHPLSSRRCFVIKCVICFLLASTFIKGLRGLRGLTEHNQPARQNANRRQHPD